MTSIEQLEKMAETNSILLSLLLNNMIAFGEETEKSLQLMSGDSLPDSKSCIIPQENIGQLNKVFQNIVQLAAAADDEDCVHACKNYVDILNQVLDAYPANFERIDMPDGIRGLYEKLNPDEVKGQISQEEKDIIISIQNTKSRLYKA